MEIPSPERKDAELSRVLVIGDNQDILDAISEAAESFCDKNVAFEFACSPHKEHEDLFVNGVPLEQVNVKTDTEALIGRGYSVIISAHCKQIFPPELADGVRCINIHPGYNPYNKGMFPHVFSIINGLPAGATIHEIDERVDHGAIIEQVQVPVRSNDTSDTLYVRVVDAELELLRRNLGRVIAGGYQAVPPEGVGNLNTRNDYDKLREIDVASIGSFGEHITLLRALSHGDRKNAYYIDKTTGKKVWVRVVLEEEE